MSFILDALKKADMERRRGELPRLQTIHEGAGLRKRGGFWRLFAVSVLLLNAAVILSWLWLRPSGLQSHPRGDRTSLPVTAGSAGAADSSPVRESLALEPTALSSAGEISSLSEAPETAAPQVRPATGAREIPPAVTSTPEKETPANPPRHKTSKGSTTVLSPAVGAPESEAGPSSKAKPAVVLRLDDLPPGEGQSLTDLAISLHYYTTRPAARMVRINGRNLREGDEVRQGLRLAEITPSGVVIDFQGRLVSLGDY